MRMPESDLKTLMPLLIREWRRFLKLAGPEDVLQTREFRSVVEAVKSLCQKRPADSRELKAAKLLYFWPLHYQQGLALINELPKKPQRVLDYTGGCAPFSFAALKQGAKEAVAVGGDAEQLKLGANICGRYGYPVSIRKWGEPVEGKFDLIIVSHTLKERFPEMGSRAGEFLYSLFEKLTPEGFLMVAESSETAINRQLLAVRDELVEKGVAVQAPCVWRGACPALKTEKSPCYAQREMEIPELIAEIHRAGRINLRSLKMSYFIFRHPESGWPALPEEPLYRVISPPVESRWGRSFYLCGTDGKKRLGTRLQKHPKEMRAFEYLKRGELIAVEEPLRHGNGLDLVEGSRLKVVAPLNKPLPDSQAVHEEPVGGEKAEQRAGGKRPGGAPQRAEKAPEKRNETAADADGSDVDAGE